MIPTRLLVKGAEREEGSIQGRELIGSEIMGTF